jgi:hypothetical protein
MAEEKQWKGKMIDANGRVGQIELEIADEHEGRWSVHISERNTSFSVEGRASIKQDKGGLTFVSISDSKGEPMRWRATLTRAEAGHYAKSALLGQYESEGSAERGGMSRGVVVLWNFGK